MGLATELATAFDPVTLAEQVGMVPDPWQAKVLRSPSRQLVLNCSRQSGKSTITALLALHEALYQAPALVLLLSPSLRQSQELYGKVREFYTAVADSQVAVQEESALRMRLTNSSRIVSLPGKEATVRGYSGVSLLVIDEAARVADDLYFAIRPMLAVSSGRLAALSTPAGKRGWFHEQWTDGSDTWERVQITAQQCPRISPEWLAQERGSIGEWWYRQEYECQFLETEDQLYRYEDIQAALDPSVLPL